ncbi:MAG: NAD-dependent epimerase/dehydratase family protein [Planctomycetota bacterium]
MADADGLLTYVPTMASLRLGITGAAGMLGWHMRCACFGADDLEVRVADRATFQDPQAMQGFARDLDVLVHFAGLNRGEDQEVHDGNIALGAQVLDACDAVGAKPHLVFSNSTHCEGETSYGASKRTVSENFRAWAIEKGVGFHDMVLPHVFGEHGKPFYNSVVHTFCHQLARGEEPTIHVDGMLELVHSGDVADVILQRLREDPGRVEAVRVEGRGMKVSALLETLRAKAESYGKKQVIPDLSDRLHLQLFNTLRAAMYPDAYPVDLKLHADERGDLFEAVKGDQGGQSFLSTTRPGITRGNHFHRHKVERFLVVRGEAVIGIRRLFDEEVLEFRVSGTRPQYIDMPTLHTHNITNVGDEDLLTLFWSHEIFDPNTPDTLWEEV